MYEIARANPQERGIIFENTAAKMGINAAVVEKDFWVCLTLDYLFHHSTWVENLAFKGGTSLSKAYNLIQRFSEDIDLILDWRVLGYRKDEPWEKRSNTKQQQFIDDAHQREELFLRDTFSPVMQHEMSALLGIDANIYFSKDQDDQIAVNFEYPCEFQNSALLRAIRLEIGALASWTPTKKVLIRSYAAENYANIFAQADTEILTTTPERTFWEKATILHQEAQRPETSKIPKRYSRHYYDLYCMTQRGVLNKALEQPDLLTQVADFKNKFYPRRWAHYELARIGTLKLMPARHNVQELERDYADMKSMIYGDYPSFEEILSQICKIEQVINQ